MLISKPKLDCVGTEELSSAKQSCVGGEIERLIGTMVGDCQEPIADIEIPHHLKVIYVQYKELEALILLLY